MENAPASAAGRLAWRVAQSAGVWRQREFAGGLAGLDWPAALARAEALDPHAERGALITFLEAVEAGAMAGAAAARERREGS